MSLPPPFLRLCFLACLAFALTNCEESLQGVDTRDEHLEDDIITTCTNDCEETLFDFNDLTPNAVVSEAVFPAGTVTIEAFPLDVDPENPEPLEVRVFDTDRTLEEASTCPTFDDDDLLFPGGPFGNVLVIQDENSPLCANDRRAGGVINFDFRDLGTVTIQCLQVFDTEESGIINGQPVSGAILLFDENLSQIGDLIPVPGLEDGETAEVVINESGIGLMEFVLLGSGAIADICASVDEPLCPPGASLLDFDQLETNEEITNFVGIGIEGYPTPAIAFNTVMPEMCDDFDDDDMVLTPPIEGREPDFDFGNVLVNQHRSRTDCANADPRGGMIAFSFPSFVSISSMDFIDTEEEGGYVLFYGQSEIFLGAEPIPVTEDGGYGSLSVDRDLVSKMVVYFAGSGGIDNICYTPSEIPVDLPEYDGCTYDYQWWKKNLDQACIDVDAQAFCGMTYRDVLTEKARGRKYYLLAHEYVTAFLNVSCNGAPFNLIAAAWGEAGLLLNQCAGVGPEADALLYQLKAFNAGLKGPGSCE